MGSEAMSPPDGRWAAVEDHVSRYVLTVTWRFIESQPLLWRILQEGREPALMNRRLIDVFEPFYVSLSASLSAIHSAILFLRAFSAFLSASLLIKD
jgi:hypothetical protein